MIRYCCAQLLIVLFFLIGVVSLSHADTLELRQTKLKLDTSEPDKVEVGDLIYRGGIALESSDNRFGGWSGLVLSPDGRRMLAVGDQGSKFEAMINYDENGNLSALEAASIGPLTDPRGNVLRGKPYTDAEAITPGARGELVVSFERNHRIWVYQPGITEATPMPPPDELARAPNNGGIEALTITHKGQILAIAEGLGNDDTAIGWISSRSGWSVLTYAVDSDYRAAGAATLPNGDILILERRFNMRDGVAVRIKQIPAATIKPGAHLEGRILAELKPPMTVDNFEAIEAIEGTTGNTLIFILSDDNFRSSQRTILMMFELGKSDDLGKPDKKS